MSYKDISKAIPCSMGTISYYLGSGQKEKTVARNKQRRRDISTQIKAEYGGCCAVCGYNKCIAALEFDHLVPSEKKFTVSSLRNDLAKGLAEAGKCILLCSNHHRERHAGLLDIGAYLEPDL